MATTGFITQSGTSTTGTGSKSVTLTAPGDISAERSIVGVSVVGGGAISVESLKATIDGTNYGVPLIAPGDTALLLGAINDSTIFYQIGPDYVGIKESLTFGSSGTLTVEWSVLNDPKLRFSNAHTQGPSLSGFPRPLITATASGADPTATTLSRPSINVNQISTLGVTLAGTAYSTCTVTASIDGTHFGTATDFTGLAISGGVNLGTTHYQVGAFSTLRITLTGGDGTSTASFAWAMRTI